MLEKFLKNKKIIIVLIGLFALILGFMVMPRYFKEELKVDENRDSVIGDESIYNPVNVSESEELYQQLESLCDGVLVLEQNEKVCKSHEDYKKKLFGYSYEGEDVVLYVKVMQNINGISYNLEGGQIGVYDGERENELLESGTTYLYRFAKEKEEYHFQSLQKMVI